MSEPENWLYSEHRRVTESVDSYAQWKDRRMVVSFDPESFAFPELFDGAARAYDCEVSFIVQYSRPYKNLVDKIGVVQHKLTDGGDFGGVDAAEAKKFVNNLGISARCVLEYRRKTVQISSDGDLQILQNNIRTAHPDGLSMGPQHATILRSGGDANADYRDF